VIVTGVEDDRVLKDAVEAGCAGYVCKTNAAENLAIAVRAAYAGSTTP
jgi:DNA-binding NarL/FixJ family response regulator